MDTGSFPGVKRPGRGADHPPPSKCRGQERVELYLYFPSGPSWPVMGAPILITGAFCCCKLKACYWFQIVREISEAVNVKNSKVKEAP